MIAYIICLLFAMTNRLEGDIYNIMQNAGHTCICKIDIKSYDSFTSIIVILKIISASTSRYDTDHVYLIYLIRLINKER